MADPLSGMDMLVVTQYDVTPYVAAELEVKRVLDVEHKLLEEILWVGAGAGAAGGRVLCL